MHANAIRDHRNLRPFRPFTLHLANGDSARVARPELMLLDAADRTLVVKEPGSRYRYIDLLMIAELTVEPDADRSDHPEQRDAG